MLWTKESDLCCVHPRYIEADVHQNKNILFTIAGSFCNGFIIPGCINEADEYNTLNLY